MAPARVLVVVSYYDARPVQPLDDLLHGLRTRAAGWPFAVRVVVNQDAADPTDLAGRHPDVEVLHRENRGYNIGAWEHGWRTEPAYEAYLFLQHECVVTGDGWLRPFVERAAEPGTGLVGERLNPAWDATWEEVGRRFAGHELPDHRIDGRPADRLATYRHFFAAHGIEPGPRADHLQALVLFARRQTLLAIGGMPVGRDYGEAIAAEIAISKKVQARGLAIRQVGDRPFRHFVHPQWQHHDRDPGPSRRSAPRAEVPAPPRLGLDRWLRESRATRRFADRPWLLLGKGPTFAPPDAALRAAHHLFGLNHVVREVPVTVAHVIDVEVVQACAEALRRDCRWLLMPRVPHVGAAPGDRLLEEWFAELPVLAELEGQGRLVWYNCSTARAHPGSPVVEVRHFSSEAALEILGRLGARRVRSLGIDGGRRYSSSFADLAATTRLTNGQPLFDLQFDRLRRIAARHRIDCAPLVPPLRVCIGGGPDLELAGLVLEYTIRRHGALPMEFARVAHAGQVPAGAVYCHAANMALGDIAALRDGSPAECLAPVPGLPWRDPLDPSAATWLDLFAEAVNAGVVRAADVRRAVARGHASPLLRRLPPPAAPAALSAQGSELQRLEHRVRCLARELANTRLSLTFRVGRVFLAPVRAAQRWLRR